MTDEQVKDQIRETVKSMNDDEITDLLFTLRTELRDATKLAGSVLESFEELCRAVGGSV